MEVLTEDQQRQIAECKNPVCDCDPTSPVAWSKRMRAQGWVDFGYDFTALNPVHADDPDYDSGVTEAYENR